MRRVRQNPPFLAKIRCLHLKISKGLQQKESGHSDYGKLFFFLAALHYGDQNPPVVKNFVNGVFEDPKARCLISLMRPINPPDQSVDRQRCVARSQITLSRHGRG